MPARFSDTPVRRRSATVAVRDAAPADRADLREVAEAAYATFAIAPPLTVYANVLPDVLDFDNRWRRGQLMVAEVEGRVRGSVVFHPNTFTTGMGWPRGWAGGHAITVHPDARRHGVERALLAECERRARVSGARTFAFHTASLLTDTTALYEGLGYCRVPHFDLDMTTHHGHPASRPMMAIAYCRNLQDHRRR
jgi:GNAT superfamily N-acetyltransferase